uniref:Poly(A) RNA polymerase cid14 n=1 Tax=Anthurium amnicola TaxID=1678845 RepID=A0A1D1YZA5_9ARAE
MGNQEVWAHPDRIPLNGLLPNEVASVTRVLDPDRWSMAEARIAELIKRIQPNQHSEERRNAVVNYVQQLIMKCFSCQVFTFGSVPLKTYLPDGDIDMSAFSNNLNLKDTWANDVRDMLENEEKSENAEFRVKEVQYIQAEVKIIKCLVENIVVDISFNQLGGLCTLCFLEEIDQFINQDHLFKRSIILIKAWCYYESRILGAHHGLISTYALEILVLYIFHVFNNSFSGPLEVLYRFLEFFSNFDWDHFCVSLWGPVPISSLPDIAAEPPRKDNGGLLLSKIYLDACSSKYSVFPGGQESQGQPFVSKFFNVIDPLRTNNNLGRSVSKGNFYRIRSAFAFGAKRLAGLLECSEDDLIGEVNKFFMNTWKRHGSGPRPDAPSPDLWNMQPLNSAGSVEESENTKIHMGPKRTSENAGPLAGREYQTDGAISSQGISSQFVTTVNQHTQNMHRSGSSSTASSQNRKSYGSQTSSRVSDQIERSICSSEPAQSDRGQKSSRPDFATSEYGVSRFQFARTRSSPELSDTSAGVSTQRQNKVPESVKNQIAYSRPEQNSRRKRLVSETSGNYNARSSVNDPSSLRHSSSNQSLDVAADSNCSSNSYHDDTGFVTSSEEFAAISEALDMRQEEQDLVNMMASSRVSNFNGQVQLPMNFPSAHVPLPLSPSVLASMGFPRRNLAGILPGNIPLIKPPWGPVVQLSHGLASSQLPNYFHNAGLTSNQEEILESSNESSSMTEVNLEDDHCFWQEKDTGSMGVADSRNFQMLHSDDKQMPYMGLNSTLPPGVNNSGGSFVRGQHKVVREDRLANDDFSDAFLHQNNRGQDTYSADRVANFRFMANSQPSSSRSKSSSESSWDGPSTKASKSGRDKRGRKPTASAIFSPSYGEAKRGWQYDDASSDHVSVPTEDENKDWVPLSMMGTDVIERSMGPMSSAPSHASGSHLSGYESAQMSGSDAVVPVAPMLVGPGSQPRTGDNTGVVPFAFFPTGPPVPFLAMLPWCNFPAESGNSDGSTSQLDNGLDNGHMNSSDKNFDLGESSDQVEVHLSPGSVKGASFEHLEEQKPDILNSDFLSHLQNLQYGRFCQNTRYPGPLVYPSPVVIPPLYLQGHFPWDGPGRPLSANMDLFTYGTRLVPVAPLQPGQSRPSSVFQRYGDEVPRYRGGTGTYLPNPKVSYRDRQSPRVRGHRGNYNYERSDHVDREGSWISPKSRAAGRSHGRNHTERPSTRPDRLSMAENRSDRPWDSHRNEPTSYQNHISSFSSTNKHGSVNMAHGIYPLPALNSNGVNPAGPGVPSMVMLYSYDPSAAYASSSEQLEFGSLGPVHLFGLSEAPQPADGGPVRIASDQRQGAYQQVSPHSSPDQPSSPQTHRRR